MSKIMIFDDSLEGQFNDITVEELLEDEKTYLDKIQNEYDKNPNEIKKFLIVDTKNNIEILSQENGLKKYIEKIKDRDQ